jgi:hypothetical protein
MTVGCGGGYGGVVTKYSPNREGLVLELKSA